MKWALPSNVNPTDTVCVQFNIPDDPAYLAAFWGAILSTTNWFNWERDNAHTGAQAAARMRKMYAAAMLGNCTPVPPPPLPPVNGGGLFWRSNVFKQPTDTPCLLQAMCPDGSYDTIFDASLCSGNNTNPPPGVTPPSGGCTTYAAMLNANQQLLIPANVSTGDVITLLSANGAANDGTNVGWWCEDGEVFVAGACIGGQITSSGDPAPTLHHMTILAKIGSAYFDLAAGPITVPSGVTNSQLVLQVNDSSLTDNSGSFVVSVKVCNNGGSSSPGVLTLDFTAGMQNFQDARYNNVPSTSYVAGHGWSVGNAADQIIDRACRLINAVTQINGITLEVEVNSDHIAAYSIGMQTLIGVTSMVWASSSGTTIPTTGIFQIAATGINQNTAVGNFLAFDLRSTNGAAAIGSIVVRKMIIYYSGPSPF